MQRRAVLFAACAPALLLAVRAARAAEGAITIDNFTFAPATLTIPVGTKITWINNDDIPHVVISSERPPLFRSSVMDTEESYTMTFDKPGHYAYFCALHPHMQGTVVVT
jgi:plastocyanin